MEKRVSQSDIFASRIFFNSAIPLLKVIINDTPSLKKKLAGKSFIFQISALYNPETEADEEAKKFDKTFLGLKNGKLATHIIFENGDATVKPSEVCDNPTIELCFSNIHKFVDFFAGRGTPLPKMKGVLSHLEIFIPLLKGLLTMAKLLGAKDAPKKASDQVLAVKLFFYLLANGISQLNKLGHKDIHAFCEKSPDRAYAFAVTGYPELQSYIRVFAGNSKAGRGEYPRCKPFLTLRFDSPLHALDILMGKGDMIDYMANKYLTVEGAPEFAAIIGEYLFAVGDFAKGLYLDNV